MDEKIAENSLLTVEEFTEQVDTRPLFVAKLEEFAKWFTDACQALADVARGFVNTIQEVIKGIEKRDRERSKERRFNAPKPRMLLLDKRSKIHRCRNAC